MKRGFFLSGAAHGMLVSFLYANGVFYMPDKQYENLEKLDIMVLTEAEFDAMVSLPPSVDNLSNIIHEKPEIFSQDLTLKSSINEIPNDVNQYNINKLKSIISKNEKIKSLEPLKDFIPEIKHNLEKKIDNYKKLDIELEKMGNEINSIDTPSLAIPKPRESERIDIIASDKKNTDNVSDDVITLNKDNSENIDTEKKDNRIDANKEASTKITPDAQKEVEIISGVVETSTIPPKRNFPETIETAKLEENLNSDLQKSIDQLVESVNQDDDNSYENIPVNPSISTMEKLKLRKSINQLISRYWNKSILIGQSDFENYVVKVEILLDSKGNIVGNIRPIEPSIPYGRYVIAFREASNAIKAVGKIPIPSEKYKKGLKLKLTFDPAFGIVLN